MIVASISVVEIIVLVALIVIALLFAGGDARRQPSARQAVGKPARADRGGRRGARRSRAQDRGWERATIEAAARAAVAPREVQELHLVQVVDKPGTDADQAVFRVVGADGAESTVTLGRRDGAWVAV